MAGYLKFDGIEGNSSQALMKLGDIKGNSKFFSGESKNRIRQLGISMQGISQLESGKLITNQNDMRIIAQIVLAAV